MASRILFILTTFRLVLAASSPTAETTSITTSADPSVLASDLSSLPECGMKCISTAGKKIGCASTDLECLWDVRQQICDAVKSSSNFAALASASAVIASDMSQETGSGAQHLTRAGLLGAVAWGALLM
ncbi:hypothetical protein FPHYL_4679 [Fusarium phyllophilum]|uniref:CFEM domain-containing protein n=1 Tax=Fusarium phyllophilum TaxID=47803 RepID=A0A8H5NH66_9HYPO|nr:hypothetical protein FPHYL_4679 [Fusarium phyllophilum]